MGGCGNEKYEMDIIKVERAQKKYITKKKIKIIKCLCNKI